MNGWADGCEALSFEKKESMDQSEYTHFPIFWSDIKSFTDDVLEICQSNHELLKKS